MIIISTTALAAALFGVVLDHLPGQFHLIYLAAALACGASAFVVRKIPDIGRQRPAAFKNPLAQLGLLRRDKLFAYVLAVWFLFGIANLWAMPLRVVKVCDPQRGLGQSALMATVLIAIIPELTRFLFTPFWARLFDRMNFIALRMVLNCFFALGLFLFFFSSSLTGLFIGTVCHGIGFSGGGVAWNLWVTKFAPPQKVSSYMSIHTFFTGVRGVLGPFLGFAFIATQPLKMVALISSGLFLISILLLAPLLRLSSPAIASAVKRKRNP